MKKLVAVILCVLLSGCQTTGGGTRTGKGTGKTPPDQTANARPVITGVFTGETLGDIAFKIIEQSGGSLVIMGGLESKALSSIEFTKIPYDQMARQLAQLTGNEIQDTPNYLFMYPATYAALTEVSIDGPMDPAYEGINVTAAFGFDTPLYEVFALLSHALNITIVGDNVIAAARCGTMALTNAPLRDALTAILKSARIPNGSFAVESTPEFLFIHSPQYASAPSALLNADELSAEANAVLDKQVDLYLPLRPENDATLKIPQTAVPLGALLSRLSEQLGVGVEVAPGLDEVPVNPCVMRNVRVRTALDLLIRQWPVPKFGYKIIDDKVLISFRPS